MVIGGRLVPVMCRSRHAPYVVFCAAAATVVLGAVPIEAWVLPVCVLAEEHRHRVPVAVGAGIFVAMLALFLLGRLGGGEAVGFVLETSGLRSIHDFQAAREIFGVWTPLFAGWRGSSARDIAVMAGQRGFPSPMVFVSLVAVNALLRALLIGLAAESARRSRRFVRFAAEFAVIWWLFLAAASLVWARW